MAVTLNANTSTGFIATSDTSGVLQLQTGGTAAVTVDASQNVGIGTASPASFGRFVAKQSADTSIAALGIVAQASTTDTFISIGYGSASDTCRIYSSYLSTGAFKPISFWTSDTERMRIDSSGNVGIGTSSPAAGAGSGKSLDATGPLLSGGAINAHQTNKGVFEYTGNETKIRSYGATSNSGQIVFSTGGGGSADTERMRIDYSGNLVVGTTTASPVSGSGFKFMKNYESAGNDRTSIVFPSTSGGVPFTLYSTGAGAYRFYVDSAGTISATSTTITSLSDQRLKENIRDLDDGLEKVMALQPRKFDWKEGKGADIKNARGFIAQEFEAVFPDMIGTWLDEPPEGEEPYKSVRADLIPTLVKAIQEMKAIIDTQASTITSLTDRITALEGAK